MEINAFYEAIEKHPELRGVSIGANDAQEGGQFAVEHITSKLSTVVPCAAVESADWPVLEEILTGQREPEVLHHITRVVGYYSRVENWNKSKLGELNDRRKGRYAFAEAQS